jgi:tetratricopeptide (TPR) repeat protein
VVNLAAQSKPHSPARNEPAPGGALASDAVSRSGLDHFYNMEYDKAIHDFELAVQARPDDPFAANRLLTAVVFKELYRIGALDTELYSGEGFQAAAQVPPDPQTRQRIRELTDRALALAERRLQANPNDVDALYARAVARGTRATTLALMDKSWVSALRNALGARHDDERVLELNPNYTDAKMVIGMHSYIVGSLSWGMKVAASLVGISGNKEKGIQYLYEAANGGGDASVDAKIALTLFLRREHRYAEALDIVGGLMKTYPHSFLFALEYANLLNFAGRCPEAAAAFRKVIAGAQGGQFQDPWLDQAAWGLGESLRWQRDFAAAAAAYEQVPLVPRCRPDFANRANLAAGQMYDLLNQRDLAVRKYQQVIAAAGSSPSATQARRYLKQAYQLPKA